MKPVVGEENVVGLALDRGLTKLPPEQAYADGARVTGLIREAARAAGLGSTDPDSPLRDIIEPGMCVLVKPNWVLHRNEGGHGMACMVTQPAFVLGALAEICRAKPARIILGDAPIQACDFGLLVSPGFRREAQRIAADAVVSLEIIDFRRTIAVDGRLDQGVREGVRSEDRYLLFDLGSDSLLEPISRPAGRFRVTNYDPRRLARCHGPGRHRYLLCREAFEADLIVSLPKLKTHRKAGMSGALKNLVGLNGNKDFLPHHRAGGTHAGGDCYPGRSLRKRFAEFLLDVANRRVGTPAYNFWGRMAWRARRGIVQLEDGDLEGSWYGNDTCWRMVLDLNRILLYGRPDGTMAETRQRKLWSLTDAIVCGQGEGPLAPRPLAVGAVTVSDSSPVADAVHAALLRLDANQLALVRESFGAFRWPLVPEPLRPVVRWGATELSLDQVAADVGASALAPRGWASRVERRTSP